ncbi:Ig-like domain-containing protein [Stieleria varia]|nr:Ig-like domain-containing protein [Stieleria varia]
MLLALDVSLQVIRDAEIIDTNRDGTFDVISEAALGMDARDSAAAPAETKVVVLEFDTTSIPAGTQIEAAALEFFVQSVPAGTSYTVEAFLGDGNILLSDATAVGVTAGTFIGGLTGGNAVSLDPVVLSGAIASGALTLRIHANTPAGDLRIHSREGARSTSFYPNLRLTLAEPPGTEQTAISVSSDAEVIDTNRDGSFDVINFSGNTIAIDNRVAAGDQRVGVFEFSTSSIPTGSTIISAALEYTVFDQDVNSTINIDGFAGDGTVQLSDASVVAPLLGTFNASMTGVGTHRMLIDPALISAAINSGSVTIRARSVLDSGGTTVRAIEDPRNTDEVKLDVVYLPPAPTIDLAGGLGLGEGAIFYGAESNDVSARSVDILGDLNGDGYDDVLIGALGGDGLGNGANSAGESYIVFGSASLNPLHDLVNPGVADVIIYGADNSDESGSSVSGIGDFNGDGFDDIAIAAVGGDGGNNSRSDSGEVYVFYGGLSLPGAINLAAGSVPDLTIYGADLNDRFGASIAGGGDVNGDGLADLLVGAFAAYGATNSENAAGDAYIIYGSTTAPPQIDVGTLGTAGVALYGGRTFDQAGVSVTNAGDVDGDGYADVLIGVPGADGPGDAKLDAGAGYLVFGGPTLPPSLSLDSLGTAGVVIHGVDSGDRLGDVLSGAGDVNGDGLDDILVAATNASGETNTDNATGEAFLIYGQMAWPASIDLATPLANGFVIYGANANDFSGKVQGGGDINGDGLDDILISSPGGDPLGGTRNNAGEAHVLFGRRDFPSQIRLDDLDGFGDLTLTFLGADAMDGLGEAIAMGGDVNGDGYDDVLLGAPAARSVGNGRAFAGETYLIYGRDFIGGVTRQGTPAGDTITGSFMDEIIVAGGGDDRVISRSGTDSIRGGQGDDTIQITPGGFERVVGGTGVDTLEVVGTGTLNLRGLPDNRILGVEAIDLTDIYQQTLQLDVMDVLNISDESNELIVRRNLNDTVDIGGGWNLRGDTLINTDWFEVYEQGNARLLLEHYPFTVSGVVFEDMDAAGDRDIPEDLGLSGVELQFFRDGGDNSFGNDGNGLGAGTGIGGDDDILIATFLSGVDGTYSTPRVAAGTYFLRASLPSRHVATTSTFPRIVELTGNNVTRNFGSAIPGSIHGFKFEDLNRNGVYEPLIDAPMSGVTFRISGIDGKGSPVNQIVVSDANGEFSLTGLLPSVRGESPGTGYVVSETVPQGQVATTPPTVIVDLQSDENLVAQAGQANLVVLPLPELDSAFGVDGAFIHLSDRTALYASALQSDGKIVSVGRADFGATAAGFRVTRLNSDGTLDTTFGVGGDVEMQVVDPDDRALTVAIQDDGKILVGGRQGTGDFGFVTRLNADGSVDTSFATGGTLLLSDPADNHVVEHLLVQPDGKIVFNVENRGDIVVVRLNSDGTFDNSFGIGGYASIDAGQSSVTSSSAIALQSDGKIVAVPDFTNSNQVKVVRFTAAGAVDTGFGFGGVNSVFLSGNLATGHGVVIQPDARILVSASNGTTNPIDGTVFNNAVVMRLMPNGALDTSFANSGIYLSDSIFPEFIYGPTLGLLSSGNVVLGVGRGSDSGITTLDPSGALLERGVAQYTVSVASHLFVQPDDGLIVTGSRHVLRYSDVRVLGDEIDSGSTLQFGNVRLDFGDAPDSYRTLLSNSGARHYAVGPTLGPARDGDSDAQAPLDGSGDGADEDGVTIGTLTADQMGTVTVNVQGSDALLDAWVDYDRNGVFDPTDRIATALPVFVGDNVLNFTVPPDAVNGGTYARFRLSTAGVANPFGLAVDGEVEDYAVTLVGDTQPPRPVITGPSSPSNLDPFDVTIDFGEEVNGFDGTDIVISGATVVGLTDDGGGVFTATIDALADGLISMSVPSNRATDRSGKWNQFSNSYFITIDTVPPAPFITGPIVSPVPDFFTVSIHFGEAAILQDSDLIVTGGVIDSLTNLGGGVFQAVIDASGDGTVTVQLPAGVASDLAGNPNLASNLYSIDVDATPPTPTITGPVSPIASSNFDVTITFDDIVFGFVDTDITVVGGSVASLVDNGGGIYTATISAVADVMLSISVGGGLTSDVVGNLNLPSNVFDIRVDTLAPMPIISATNPNNQDPFTATIDFGESVNGFDLTDLLVTGGAASNLTDQGNGRYTVSVDAMADGDVSLQVPAGAAIDDALLASLDSGVSVVTVDTTRPNPVIMNPGTAFVASRQLDLTVVFGEEVTGFGLTDVLVAGGSATSITALPTPGEYVVRVVAAADGPLTVQIDSGIVFDMAGNINFSSNVIAVTVDTVRPTPVLTAPLDPQSNPFLVTVDFGEDVTGFDASDLVVTGGTTGAMTMIDARTYTVEITAPTDGPVRIELPADQVVDAALNGNDAASQLDVVVDTLNPVPVITGPAGPTNADLIDVTITFSEPVTGFDASDIGVGNGVIAQFVALSQTKFLARISTGGDGILTVDVDDGAATDLFSRLSLAAIQYSIEIDKKGPTPVLTGPASPSNQDPFGVTIDFGEPVNFFIPEDIIVFGGQVANLVDNGGGVYTATIDADVDRRVIVLLNANIAADLAGNTTKPSNALQVVVDTLSPTPVISGPASFTNNDPFDIQIDFGELVTGFDSSDLSVTNAVVSALVDNADGTFTATLTAANQGLVTVDINAGVASDIAGNPNLSAAQFSVLIDTAGLVPFITGPAGPAAVDSFDITINFGEAVNGFEIADLVIDGGIARDFINLSPGLYHATIDAARDGVITVNIPGAIALDLAGNLNLPATQYSMIIDRIAPTPVITGPASPTSSDPLTVSVDFGEPVTGFGMSSLAVGGGVVTGIVDLLDGEYLVTVDVATDGILSLDLAGGVAIDGAGNSSLPAVGYTTVVDTGFPTPVLSGPTGLLTQSVFVLSVDFGEIVGGFTANDLMMVNGVVRAVDNLGGGQYAVTIESIADGVVSVDIPAGVVLDVASNPNSSGNTYSVFVDTATPLPLLTTTQSETNQNPFAVEVDFGEEVVGLLAGDFLVAGGSVVSLTDLGGGRYAASVSATSDGGVSIALPLGAANDLAGNVSRGSQTLSVVVDTTGPSPTLSGPSSPTNHDPFSVVVSFGEEVLGFVANDLLVSGGLVTGLTSLGNGQYIATIDADADGTVTVGLNADEVTDLAGNGNVAASSVSVEVDTVGPMVMLSGPVSPTPLSTFDVAISFGQPVNGFTVRDVSVSGGLLTGLIDNGGGDYVATITANGEGSVFVSVPQNAVTDDAGNANTASGPLVIVVDTVVPQPVLQTVSTAIRQNAFDVLIRFGEVVSGFDASDVMVQGGVLTNLIDNGQGLYTATMLADGEGFVTVSVPSGVVADGAGSLNVASDDLVVKVDLSSPKPVLSATRSHVNTFLFDVGIDFAEPVSGFGSSDLIISGGSLVLLRDNGDGSFTATVNAAFDGTVSVAVAAGSASDLAGNLNLTADPLGVVVDTIAPSVVLSASSVPTNATQVTISAAFSESVSGLDTDDFTVSGGVVNQVVHQGGNVYDVLIDVAGDGLVSAFIPTGAATDLAGNTSRISNTVSVVVDQVAPVPRLSGPVTPINFNQFGVTIDFGEFVNDIDAGDVVVTGGTVSSVNHLGNGRFGLTVDGEEGIVTVDVPAGQTQDAAGNDNLAATPLQVIVDFTAPTPVISGPQNPLNVSTFDVVIDFGEAVRQFTADDISVVGGAVGALVDNNDGTYTASVTAVDEGVVTLRVASGAARDFAGNLSNAALATEVVVDLRGPRPSLSGPFGQITTPSFVASIDFGETVTGFVMSDVSLNGSGATVTQVVDVGGGRFDVMIATLMDGAVVMDVAAGVASDLAGNPSLVAVSPISFNVAADLDFGDAPSSAQSGFAGSYPVLLSDDGARHSRSTLVLGQSVDSERDGTPTVNADGDGADEDGIGVVTSLLVAPSETTSSVSIEVSGAGKLNGWIDFNRDGDWEDAGEQIFVDLAVLPGMNLKSFQIPAGALAGLTAARFRLNDVGGLLPSGAATGGEVEDYMIDLVDTSAVTDVSVDLVGNALLVSRESDELVIREGQTERLRVPADGVNAIQLSGTDGDDIIVVDGRGGDPLPAGGIAVDGGGGANTLRFFGADGTIDLTDTRFQIQDINIIDISSIDLNTVVIDAATIAQMSPVDNHVRVRSGAGDQIVIPGADQWRLSTPVMEGGRFYLRAEHQGASGGAIDAEVANGWHNFLRESDVNNDGVVTSLDALVIVNELRSRLYSAPNGNSIPAASATIWPGEYYDQNDDGRFSALDALGVINEIRDARLLLAGGEGERVVMTLPAQSVRVETVRKEQSSTDVIETDGSLSIAEESITSDFAMDHATAVGQATAVEVSGGGENAESLSQRDVDALFADDAFLKHGLGS